MQPKMVTKKCTTFAAILLTLAIIIGNIDDAKSWVAVGFYHNDAHPGKCAFSETLILSPGEEAKHPEDCAQISCNNEDGEMTIMGCGSVAPPENCEWGGYIDIHAPYSQCCAQILICDHPTNQTRQYQQNIADMFRRQTEEKQAATLNGVIAEPTKEV